MTAPITLTPTSTQQATPLVPSSSAASGSGMSFGDILDAVNPLQHIPVISSIYRAATGSQISAGSQIAGDTLYGVLLPGGAIAGLASSAADVAVKAISGKSIAGNALSVLSSSSTPAATPLVPTTQTHVAATTTTGQTPIAPIPLSSAAGHSANSQYQRVQALDSLNQKLVKLKI